MKTIGVLIVEDSDVVRQLLQHIIGGDPRFEIVGLAASAEEALEIMQRVSPDVISLDIRLPGMNGFEVTRRIMSDKPTPIVVCSASVESDELKITMNALRAGALTVVEKPVGTTRADYERLARTLCTQLAIMSDVKVVRQRASADSRIISTSRSQRTRTLPSQEPMPGRIFRLLGIGASTGGPNAVVQVLADLGRNFRLPILLVQHMMPSFLAGFASWLEGLTPFRVVVAQQGELLAAGTVHVAPPDHHLQLEGNRVQLTQGPLLSAQRPSATAMFQSMARTVGEAGVGVLLTGMGDDGADGLLELRQAGGYTIAEHESTAVVYGMPKAAVDRGAVCESRRLNEIASRVLELVSIGQET
jgi:two-component system chemotaxis response regulator CheB